MALEGIILYILCLLLTHDNPYIFFVHWAGEVEEENVATESQSEGQGENDKK